MSVRTQHSYHATWFVTFTCYGWKPLFELTNGYDLVYNWFSYLRQNSKAEIIAYVIMPNHFHAIMYLPDTNADLNKLIGNGKRFMAYEIVERFKASNNKAMLSELAKGVSATDKKKGQKHRVFETSFDAKVINSARFLMQKMRYIHQNPVSGKWKLADDYTAYKHSSASYYELGKAAEFVPFDYRAISNGS